MAAIVESNDFRVERTRLLDLVFELVNPVIRVDDGLSEFQVHLAQGSPCMVNSLGHLVAHLGQAIEQVERPPADRYLIVRDGTPEAEVMWDGVTEFDPGEGVELVRTAEWKGERYTGPPEPEDARARRTTNERLDTLIGHLRDDLRAFDGMTANQRQAAQKRALRAVVLLARVVRDDHAGDVE